MSNIRAVIVDPNVPGRLALSEVAAPTPAPDEALVKVTAISLNRGEVRRSTSAEAGWRPGWDLAGVVETPAADGSGPPQGSRVVGLRRSGAWAELVPVPTNFLAELPPSVSFAQAATLPVAGLTAYHALRKGGALLGSKVLITGASGGVGNFAIQLARLSGAQVVAHIRQASHEALVKEAGAHSVVVGEDLSLASEYGPYNLILDSVGGNILGTALGLLIDRNRITGAGVTSGIDFGLVIAAELFGEAIAQKVQLEIEYNPQPPFESGSPQTAPPDVLANAKAVGQNLREIRRQIIQRVLAQLHPHSS